MDEKGSLIFHSGAFSIEKPSVMDTHKIKSLIEMIGDPDNSDKPLSILENELEKDVKYIHGKNSI
jgi:hypothetical protein